MAEVIDLQYSGDREAANQFVDAWTGWDEARHGAVAAAMREAEGSRFRLVTYEALNR